MPNWIGLKKLWEARRAAPPPVKSRGEGVRMLGHIFYPMTRDDYAGLGGAEPGSFICWCPDGTALVLSADLRRVSEVLVQQDNAVTEMGEGERGWALAYTA